MARQPTSEDLGGLPNLTGTRPVGGYDVSAYARGAHEIAQAGVRLGQSVAGIGDALHRVATLADQTQYVDAVSRGITKGLALHAALRANPDPDALERTWQDGTRQIIEDEAATVDNPALRQGLRAKLTVDFARQQALIADQAWRGRAAASASRIAQDRRDLVAATEVDADPLHNAKIAAHNALIDTAARAGFLGPEAAVEEKRRTATAVAAAQFSAMARHDPDRAMRELGATSADDPILAVLAPGQREALLDQARRQQQARLADGLIAAQRTAAHARQVSAQAETDTIENLFGTAPTVTADDIVNNPHLSRDAKADLLAVAARSALPDPPAQVSHATARILLDRVRLPDRDAAKITDLAPLYAAYVKQQLGRDDFLFVRKELLQRQSPDGEHVMARKQGFLRAIEPTIDRSDPLIGQLDQAGRQQMYRLERDLDRKIDEYRKQGKNPADLFDPSRSDYVGGPEYLLSYRTGLQQRAADRAREAAQTPQPPGSAVPPRRPDESPADYLRRVPPPAPPPHPPTGP